ncbi:MAG: hypothetical protein KF784_13670 [Fimbriimonadaceae bacterium]|nr:hypothetical protein [Fimbriimonadaceae bacterium]
MIRFLLALVLTVAILSGCSGDRSLVGSWQSAMKIGDQNVVVTQTFGADGTFEMAYTSEVRTSGPFGDLSVTVTGTGSYKIDDGEKLETVVDSVEIDGLPKGMGRGAKARAERELVRTRKFTVQWINDSKITLTPTQGQGFQLERIAAPKTESKP